MAGWGGVGSQPKRTLVYIQMDDVTIFACGGKWEFGLGEGGESARSGNIAYVLNGWSYQETVAWRPPIYYVRTGGAKAMRTLSANS